jgi:hypothetical protein
MTPSQIAYKAAEIMSQKGHCKGRIQDAEGRLCLYGALWMAAAGSVRAAQYYQPENEEQRYTIKIISERVATLLRKENLCSSPVDTEISWNDMPSTTMEDVVLILKRTGEEMEDEGI